MNDLKTKTKLGVRFTSEFKAAYKKLKKQGKDINKLKYVIIKLANKEPLEEKYQDHALHNDKTFNGCRDCHIEPDWVLIYKYLEDDIVLLLVNMGSHSNVF